MRAYLTITVGLTTFCIGVLSASLFAPAPQPRAINFVGLTPQPAYDTAVSSTGVTDKVISSVKNIEVIKAELENADLPSARIAVDLKNNSDLAVIAIEMECSSSRDSLGSGEIGIKPKLTESIKIIPAHDTKHTFAQCQELFPAHPLRVTGVMYEDGSTAGEPSVKMHLNEQEISMSFQ